MNELTRITRHNVTASQRRARMQGFFVGCVFTVVLAVVVITYLQQRGVQL